MMRSIARLLVFALVAGCSGPVHTATVAGQEVDSARVVGDLQFLSSPELEGRGSGSAGNLRAREYIADQLADAGVRPFAGGWLQTFELSQPGSSAANVIGYVEGRDHPDRYIVVTAHYDHLGVRGGQVYHGADDNASGTAALLELARYFAANPPSSSIIFAALDAEELGLRGARAFVQSPPVELARIALNVNMDMVGRNSEGELYASGTAHYPFLLPLVEQVAERSNIVLRTGHDTPVPSPSDDWTSQSDHGAFHAAGIPFLYFGVEDHPDYHQPTDTFENIEPAFFVDAVETVLDFIATADSSLDVVVRAGHR